MALRETLDTIRSAPDPPNEEAAKFQLVAPILKELDWDPFGPEVLYEHPVGERSGGKVDIALKGSKRLFALIEAKAPGKDLKNHVGQVLRYAFHEGVDICVLTTGLEWWMYLPLNPGPPEERRFTTLHLKEDPLEQLADDLITFLGKDNLVGGQAIKRARQVLKAKQQADFLNAELPKVWESMVKQPDAELVELVRQRIYEKVNLRPEPEQVIAVIRGAPVPSIMPPNPLTSHVSLTSSEPTRISITRRATNRPTAFLLWGDRYECKLWKDVLFQIAGTLHKRHGQEFINRLLEIRTNRGKPYASRNSDDLRAGMQIPFTDVYIETHFSAKDTMKRAHDLLNRFGHHPSVLEILYD